ncbi:hypothetical protein ATANTOWER_022896 [Ataeniobius toweri]|uniref:Uncharacterized protein n=1 Tax=Ataeniobius toweri TaxID=208326 RepID=A0ABU7AL35_9TELE|nr:hypothetical protein [Ataeniobius toweri]
MSNRILALSFSTTLSGVSLFNCGTFSTFSALTFLYTIPSTWLWHFTYALPSTIQVLRYVLDCFMGIFAQHAWYTLVSIVLVLMACSCAAMIDASVLSFGLAFTSH